MRRILKPARLTLKPTKQHSPSKLPSVALFFLAATSQLTNCHAAFSTIPGTDSNTSHSLVYRSMSSSKTEAPSKTETTKLAWADRRDDAIAKCVLPLTSTSHKGSSGRVGVLGGSARYTGAPYYAAMASLSAGADLSFVFCAEEATLPIKSYSPELMVAGVYSAKEFDQLADQDEKDAEIPIQKMVQEVTSVMDKLHCLVIGPGMGRCPIVMKATARIIREAQSRKIPLVLDADALFMLTQPDYHELLQPSSPVVLTPNKVERKRLEPTMGSLNHCVVVEKGQYDEIQYTGGTNLACGEEGGLKRSGGLGDILSGTLGTLVSWNAILTDQGDASSEDIPLACWTACCFVKRATNRSFEAHRRSMTAPDVLKQLGPAVNEMTDS
eukprot:scaffold2277_cov137-Cylindrotheca_fusiformis.AAC.11